MYTYLKLINVYILKTTILFIQLHRKLLESEARGEERRARAREASDASTMAQQVDQMFRQQSKNAHDKKNERFNQNFALFKKSQSDHLQELADLELRRNFASNQRRRLLIAEKAQQIDLAKIRLSKIDSASEIKHSLESQRNVMIHKITTEKLQQGGKLSIDTTPGIFYLSSSLQNELFFLRVKSLRFTDLCDLFYVGPGEYSPVNTRKLTGGVIGRAGALSNSILSAPPSPGPASYDLNMRPKTTGAIPFMGRGKTDTDVLVTAAKLSPG